MALQRNNDVTFSIFGMPKDDYNVRVRVFLAEVTSLIRALGQADRAQNKKPAFDYLITDLRSGSNIIQVEERVIPKKRKRYPVVRPTSGINYLRRAMTAVYNGEKEARELPDRLLNAVSNITKGVGTDFEHAEIKFDPENIVRIDDYLSRQVDRVLYAEKDWADYRPHHFAGTSFGSFDGVLKVIDSRGDLVRGKFILTTGRKPLDCLLYGSEIPDIRRCFDLRVRADAIAHYDGDSLLPIRLDIRKLTLVKPEANLLRWGGAFEVPESPSEPASET